MDMNIRPPGKLGKLGSWAPEMSGIRPLKLASHARLYILCSAVSPLSVSVGVCAVQAAQE